MQHVHAEKIFIWCSNNNHLLLLFLSLQYMLSRVRALIKASREAVKKEEDIFDDSWHLFIYFLQKLLWYWDLVHKAVGLKPIKIFLQPVFIITICMLNGLVYRFMMFNATFNNIWVILWQSVLVVEETGVPGENQPPVASHWQTLSYKVVSSTPLHEPVWNSQLYLW